MQISVAQKVNEAVNLFDINYVFTTTEIMELVYGNRLNSMNYRDRNPVYSQLSKLTKLGYLSRTATGSYAKNKSLVEDAPREETKPQKSVTSGNVASIPLDGLTVVNIRVLISSTRQVSFVLDELRDLDYVLDAYATDHKSVDAGDVVTMVKLKRNGD